MKITTLKYDIKKGWSEKNFPAVDSENTLIIVFGSPQFLDNANPIDELKSFYKKSKFAGCSTAGEIFQGDVNDDSISVAIVQFNTTTIDLASAHIDSPKESYDIGKKLALQLNKDNLKHIIVFSDGLNVNGSELAKSFNENTSNKIQISGGLAGDGSNFKQTWVIDHGKPTLNMITAVGLYGDDLLIGCGSKGGWDTFGPERTVTKSTHNVVYEIDNQPALDLYKKYLGDMAKDLPSSALLFPLAIRRRDESNDKAIVRTILSVDEKNKSLTFAGDVPEGWTAQLMRANMDRLIDGANDAGKLANISSSKENDTLAIAISCVGRRLVLGERSEEEVEATLQSFPEGTKQIGFYSYGEISPSGFQTCNLHNQTMTLTTLSEK